MNSISSFSNSSTSGLNSAFNNGLGGIYHFLDVVAANLPAATRILDFAMFFLAVFFICIMTYSVIRLFEIRKKERAHLHHEIAEYAEHHKQKEAARAANTEISKNPRWVQTLNYVTSANPNDWKLAVIEADSMLEDLMEQLGFKGAGLGEKLKSADRDKFHQLSAAWEVHTIRNRIAHEGTTFELSEREANRVIALYEQIFREFGFI